MSQITEKEVEHLAGLARIRMTDAEKTKLAHDLGSILNFVEQLKAIDTSSVEPTAQVTGLENMLRVDDPEQARVNNLDIPESQDLLLGQSPSREGRLLKIKAIFKKK